MTKKINPTLKKFSKKRTPTQKETFKKYLQKIESPDYPGVAKDLPKDATSLEKAKFAICQEFLAFKFRNHLTTQQIAKKIKLDKEETQKLLFCGIDNFSLDELVDYADRLFTPSQVKVTVQPKRLSKTIHVRAI